MTFLISVIMVSSKIQKSGYVLKRDVFTAGKLKAIREDDDPRKEGDSVVVRRAKFLNKLQTVPSKLSSLSKIILHTSTG